MRLRGHDQGARAAAPDSFSVPRLRSQTLPWIGNSPVPDLTGATPNAPSIMLQGIAPLNAPFDGETLLVNSSLSLFVKTYASGSPEFNFPLPADPQICQWTAYQPILIMDPEAAGSYHDTITNRAGWTIGIDRGLLTTPTEHQHFSLLRMSHGRLVKFDLLSTHHSCDALLRDCDGFRPLVS